MIVHDDWGYDQLGKKDILTIRLVDGSEHRAVCTTARGDAEDPLTREETIAKFRGCAENILAPKVCDAAIAILVDLQKASNRKRVVKGKSVSVRVDYGGRRDIKKNTRTKDYTKTH